MKLRRVFLICMLLFPTASLAEPRSFTVKPGQTIVVSQPHRYESDCVLVPAQISLTKSPNLGTVVVRNAKYRLGDYGTGVQKFGDGPDPCLGKNAKGPQVLYRAGDQKGVDKFTLKADFDFSRVFSVDFVIEVK